MWLSFITEPKHFKIIPEHKLLKFFKKHRHLIELAVQSNCLDTPILSEDKFTNVFVIRDKTHGYICSDCQTDAVIVYKKNMFSAIGNKSFSCLPSKTTSKSG